MVQVECANRLHAVGRRSPVAAVRQVPAGVVLDGELVITVDGRLSLDALRRRRLEQLSGEWATELQLPPVAADFDEARMAR
ncbi:hypothetical protein AB0I34_00800 [Kribbella sp. NPDC050281]|uniref:hypothetical protein n=1 Tax=Kribbella sp. NPDC050281 TaxID=3155515 RepID=UPI0033C36F13